MLIRVRGKVKGRGTIERQMGSGGWGEGRRIRWIRRSKTSPPSSARRRDRVRGVRAAPGLRPATLVASSVDTCNRPTQTARPMSELARAVVPAADRGSLNSRLGGRMRE